MSPLPLALLPTLLLALLPSQAPAPAQEPAPGSQALQVVEALETAVADAIERVQPSVVAITRIKSENGQTLAIRGRTPEVPPGVDPRAVAFGDPVGLDPNPGRPGFPGPNTEFSPEYFALPGDFGSGVVVGPNNEILTVYHLLKGAKRIRVRAPGVQFDAEIIAADPRTDLAVIVPVEGTAAEVKLKPVRLGDSTRVRQGAFLVALGNPYNAARDGKASASLGILANTARRVEPPDLTNPNIKQFFRFQPTLLQLDSKLNLGLSGGPVVSLRGELIGVTTAVASPSGYDAAAGYAIPMDALGRRAVEALLEGREVEYGFIGISLGRLANVVSEVKRGTPADRANLASGDVIVAVGNRTLDENDESSLPLALAGVPVGEPVTLKVRHEGAVVERTLVMSKYPVAGEVIATRRPDAWRGIRVDFTSVLTDGLSTEATLEAMARGGVGVAEVQPGSPAEAAGLTRGLVITRVEDQPVTTPKQFRAAVQKFDGKPVRLSTTNGLVDGKVLTIPPAN